MRRLPTASFAVLLASAGLAAQAAPRADLRDTIERFAADWGDLHRRYDVPMSPARRARLEEVARQQLAGLDGLDFAGLSRDARIDWHLLHDHVEHELAQLALEARRDGEVAPLLPFAPAIVSLCEARRRLEPVVAADAAATLDGCQRQLTALHEQLGKGVFESLPLPVCHRAVDAASALRRALRGWFDFRGDYDPEFAFWLRTPWRELDAGLERWQTAVRQKLVDGRTGDSSLVGDPIGEVALLAELQHARIPYTPAELVAVAEREFAFCDAEMLKASRELGCGDDWRAAMAKVKDRFVAPGKQPQLIADLANEAIAFVESRDLVTIPDLAKECWRMGMMSKDAQRVNPFFLGGETILVSYPTESMTQQEKLQSLRSNNEHFARATVFHELIPGHWLQEFMQARWRPYRQMFSTPFWIEGWALYWEMRLYDLGFCHGPEDRVGMLYWRKHRCARIVFSLNFHLGKWTGPQAVDYLVDRVGHERAAAEGEVRRSLGGGYGPLYQAAYMLGGLQLRALNKELVGSGAMTEKQFHDAVLQQNSIPIALVRAALRTELPRRDEPAWRFAEAAGGR
jgi:uncharacterized protein (DUF885 family)